MTITTGSFPKALWPGVKAWWGLKYDEYDMLYESMYDITTSRKAYEEIVEAQGLGIAPVKANGTGVSYQDMQQGVVNRFTNVTYGLGVQVTDEELEDNQYPEDLVLDRTERLAFSMRQTRELVGAAVYNNAFSGVTYGDGSTLISTSHATAVGAQSNRLTVDAQLSEASLEQLCIQIKRATDGQGLHVSYMPTRLIIEPSEIFNATRILKSFLQNDTANNATNAIREMGYFSEGFTANPFLTSSSAWYVRTNAPKGMMWMDRKPTEFSNDNDFDTDNLKYKAIMRFVPGFGDWRGLYGSAGA